MDRSLDDVIADKQRPRARRGGRNDDYPRDGIRKSQRDAPRDLDRQVSRAPDWYRPNQALNYREWVHDRYEDDPQTRRAHDTRNRRVDHYATDDDRASTTSAKLRVDNLHYDLTETDLQELFTRIGPVSQAQILYDRSDRSRGIGYVTYTSMRDATRAIREYDGANAFGQPIKITLLPSGPSGSVGPSGARTGRYAADDIGGGRPSRSLFDRIEDSRSGPRAARSQSPESSFKRGQRSNVSGPVPDNIDRYVPSAGGSRRRSRSPLPVRRDGRAPGTTRGARRGRDGREAGREARPAGQGRSRKTADELDAEMENYWGGAEGTTTNTTGATGMAGGSGKGAEPNSNGDNNAIGTDGTDGFNIDLNPADDDVDMIE